MHIPENYLSPQTCAVMTAAVTPAWVVSVKKVSTTLPKEKIAMMGVAASFSFLGMMFNVPLPGGTTGHAVGGTLIALLLGPYASCLCVSVALLLQALLFGDGGILAFGANCFNMAFVLPFVGYTVAHMIAPSLGSAKAAGKNLSDGITVTGGKATRRELMAAGIGAYAGLNAAALCAAIEFGIQPMLFHDAAGNALYCPYGLSVSIPAMMIGHLTLFGLVEVIFTVAVYAFVSSAAPELKASENASSASLPLKIFLAVLIIATPLGLLAEGTAWGEWGADEIAATGAGYTPAGMANGWSLETLLPDYTLAGLPDWTAYVLSAVIGVALLIIVFRLFSSVAGAGKASPAS